MAKTDANPPMPSSPPPISFRRSTGWLASPSAKRPPHRPAGCILCEGCVDSAPGSASHAFGVGHPRSRWEPSSPVTTDRPRVLRRRRGRLHPLRPVRRPVPDGVIISASTIAGRARRPPPRATTGTVTAYGVVSDEIAPFFIRARTSPSKEGTGLANGNGDGLKGKLPKSAEDEGSQAWSSIFRPGSFFRKATPTSPEPVVRDHEQRAVPPSPG